MALKLGKKPAVVTHRTIRSGEVLAGALAPLGTPPTKSADYVSAVYHQSPDGFLMLGNDEWSCCVESDDGHYLMVRTANAGTIVIPTTDQVLALYSHQTGFNPFDPSTDQGTDESADCIFMVQYGLLGHKANATASIIPENLDHLRWCIQLFGGCKFGVQLPLSAMDQFNAGQPWTILDNDGGIIGGHDVLGVQYDGEWFYVVTWGQLHQVQPAWILKYSDEAHALLFTDWIEQNGAAPNGFNLHELLAALSQIGLGDPPPPSVKHRHHRRRMRRLRRLRQQQQQT